MVHNLAHNLALRSSCPLTAALHAHALLLQIIHFFSQERRVWEQNPTPSRSSQEYIASLKGKKRRGEENVRANEKPDRSKHRGKARGLWDRSKEPAIAGRRKLEAKESLKKWGKWGNVRSMREMERDGEKLVVTRTTHCADCKWRVQDQSFPPLHSQTHSPALPSSLSTAWIYY